MGIPPAFSAMFSKGDNFRDFLFVYQEDEVFPKWGLLALKSPSNLLLTVPRRYFCCGSSVLHVMSVYIWPLAIW